MGSNLDKRLTALEQCTGDTRWIIARPHGDDDNLIHILESGKPETEAVVMTETDYLQWAAAQPDNMTIIRIVYPEDDLLAKLASGSPAD